MAQSMSRAGNCYDHANDRKPLGDPEGRRNSSTAHSATSAPKRSRRPRGSDRIFMSVHDWCAGPVSWKKCFKGIDTFRNSPRLPLCLCALPD